MLKYQCPCLQSWYLLVSLRLVLSSLLRVLRHLRLLISLFLVCFSCYEILRLILGWEYRYWFLSFNRFIGEGICRNPFYFVSWMADSESPSSKSYRPHSQDAFYCVNYRIRFCPVQGIWGYFPQTISALIPSFLAYFKYHTYIQLKTNGVLCWSHLYQRTNYDLQKVGYYWLSRL